MLRMRFRVLGTLEVADVAQVGSRQERTILALLLLRRGHVVTLDQLIDVLWREGAPASAANSVQSKISRLRRVVPGIDSVPGGYSLATGPDDVDAELFERCCNDALIARPEPAADLLRRALGLWRGRPYPELEDNEHARGEVARLDGLRLAAQERYVRALLAAGRWAEAASEAQRFVETDPYRDGLREVMMRALALDGRRVLATRAFHDYRALLAEELGFEPSEVLVALERDIVADRLIEPFEPVTTVRTDVPMAGRDTILADVCGRIERALGGQASVVVVSGDAGMGKSRLVREALAMFAGRDVAVGLGGFRADGSMPLRALEHSFAPLLPDGGRLLDGIAVSTFDRRQRTEMPVGETIDALLDRAPDRPSIVVIEDLHWADRTSVNLLAGLVTELGRRSQLGASQPLAILVTTRPDVVAQRAMIGRLGREPCVVLHDLGRLDEIALFRLVADAIGAIPTPGFVSRLREMTDGNPLLVLATLRRACVDGALRVVGEQVDATGPMTMAMPGDLEEVLTRLVDVVPADAVLVLQRCACIGRTAEIAVLASIAGATPEQVHRALRPAVQLGIVWIDDAHPDGPVATFHHDLYRRLLLERSTPADAAHIHRAAADALDTGEDMADDVVVRIARHLMHAGAQVDHRRLMRVAERAADVALAAASWAEAARFYDVAIDARGQLVGADPGADLLWRAGMAHFHNHDANEALERLDLAMSAARRDRDVRTEGAALIVRQRVVLTIDGRRAGVSEALYHDYLAAAGDDVPDLRAEIYAQMAEFAFTERRHADGERWAAEAARLGADGSPMLLTMTAIGEGVSLLGSLDLAGAQRCFDRAWERGDPNDHWYRCAVAARQAMVALIGGHDTPDFWLRVSLEYGDRAQNWSELSFASALAAMREVVADDPAAAIALGRQSLTYLARSSYAYTPDVVYPAMMAAHVRLGNDHAAAADLDRWEAFRGRTSPLYRMLLAVESGDRDVLVAAVARRPLRALLGGELDLFRMIRPAIVALVALALEDPTPLGAALVELDGLLARGVVRSLGWPLDLATIANSVRAVLGIEARGTDDLTAPFVTRSSHTN